ncbi:hypothetical protein A3K24_03485 [candidate division Kazan bacterium RIFCSPHIGHO2_01_FULL_44_14]|uniref:Uncharacterized protein n=1 Tax=candidate division Kazan bacterium RIFCSPLOWO2_01_FULL_45_19 TaxID=1798538 RepID=A0A1F4NQV9_UNCK3|nr:hypothetical protein [uncultured bacterium]AQS30245.1 hypothetical protein [uncultured bacterium]OGB73854.1 MAG: hypothetical protein A3K51_03485 [candidate division Kazan bacterium RIFCSPLOWO2_01_FULL_45_19]OGB78099.1 MAG: hypothetical protein A3K24_03485 [candidate division Kazan bacterium RIFCSPHIGHO2_01_FULL_44_14]
MEKMTPAQFVTWLIKVVADLVGWVLDGTRSVKSLEAVYLAIQAVISNEPVQVTVNRVTKTVAAAKKFLRYGGKHVVEVGEQADRSPLKAGSGIYFWGNFHSWFGSTLKKLTGLGTVELDWWDTIKSAWDREIAGELPTDYVFDANTFGIIIGRMIAQQKNGGAGILLNNGRANLFYVRDVKDPSVLRAVFVRWFAGGQRWDFGASHFVDFQWDGGRRVFAPATADAPVS